MKRYTTAQARQHLADLLDSAERGDAVVIERRGVRFVLRAGGARQRRRGRRTPILRIVDPAVATGEWTWEWDREGLRFVARNTLR